ncbi:RNA-binding cell elongation regulator Jag/EloR [Lysinibacillus sp. BW-2-10]|uniref:RNA-binding cell elongation regulator Jag/EloR n=1 Tax=Lysinibacillus sp. BW-2-10 TaxID=2590030 RepID=UPI00117DE37D|nr:RNA-binding cell elongation regulator Jag/EloR [Lysinibacillus sp. BW-2-10]TSI11122.1 protein jag [Lysinibacillus sp. BW-2-10]
MKQITQLGASKEEAISLALQNLGVTRDQVEVEVLQEAKKGFLGFGARAAEVRVTVKEIQQEEQLVPEIAVEEDLVKVQKEVEEELIELDAEQQEEIHEDELPKVSPVEVAKDYVISIAKDMGIEDLTIHSKVEGKNVLLKLESEKAALLIGKRGSTLNALQQLTQLIVNKSAKSFLLVKLDVEDYRERRQVALEQLAERMADRAIRTGRKVPLEPMPSYERKIIHNALANRIDIETYSEGTEPNRYIVIESVK